jgi:hypothetical protein
MAQEHLDTDRLLALYEGDTGDFAALEHLASCVVCQRAYDDTRWFLLLSRLPELIEAGPHPGSDVMVAYRNQALSARRTTEVERHLRSCEHCLALHGRMRAAEQAADYMSPVPASVRRVMKRFRPRRLRRLGTVLVTGLDKGLLRLFLLPVPSGIDGIVDETCDLMSGEEPRIGRADHPASAKERVRRLAQSVRSLDLDAEAIAESAAEDMHDARLCDIGPLPSAPTSDKPRPLRIPTDDVELVLTPHSEDEQCRLDVQLIPTGEERPTAGVRVRIRGPEGREAEASTDDDGRATLPFNPGDTELIIEVDPPLALAVNFPD